jgi:UDP-N-acetylmuramoylalanine--D-glutamate ligase
LKEKVVILGGGESGTGSAVLAKKQGYKVLLSDSGKISDRNRARLEEYGIPYEEGIHTLSAILDASLVIKSPGIPDTAPVIAELRERSVPVVSEIEFAGRFTDAYMICVTGSNGKTTTTNLVYHILKNAGLNVAMAGNVGESFAFNVAVNNYDYYVLELSSFQLDGMFSFRADIAILLNITPDHLDRYGYDFSRYADSKFRIINNQTSDDFLICWADDPVIESELEKRNPPVNILRFSDTREEGMAAYVRDDKLILSTDNKSETIMTIHDLALKGRHNTYNSMASAIAGKVLEIRKETIRQSLAKFQGVEHRLETVISVHGIRFINDSKATNVNSSWYALECMTSGVVWIAGGTDKGNDYRDLHELVQKKVKAIVCLGKDNSKIVSSFSGLVPTIVETSSMSEAVKSAYYLASKGDTVLLSPACASFDLFSNYEERGRMFKEEVRNL